MTNNRFEDLEKKAKKIEHKALFKNFLIFVILSGVVFLFYRLYFSPEITQVIPEPVLKEAQIEPKKEILLKEEPPLAEESPQVVVAEEVLAVENNTTTYDTVSLKLSIPQEELINIEATKPIEQKTIQSKEISKVAETSKTNDFIMEVKSADKEEILLRDYSTSKSFETAIELASIYFEKKNFKKAVFWSKEASRIHPESPRPWMIYAKAKHELNLDSDAIKALENYLSFFSSQEVAEFLNTLKGDKK